MHLPNIDHLAAVRYRSDRIADEMAAHRRTVIELRRARHHARIAAVWAAVARRLRAAPAAGRVLPLRLATVDPLL